MYSIYAASESGGNNVPIQWYKCLNSKNFNNIILTVDWLPELCFV